MTKQNKKKCFVVMTIGTNKYHGQTVTQEELKSLYEKFLHPAITGAKPNLEIIRADEPKTTGSIQKDIFHNIMFSDYVIVDITYPNVNVFYELGLRHACKLGTIILRDQSKMSETLPFDIFELRVIPYSRGEQGVIKLQKDLEKLFEEIDKMKDDPAKTDSRFLDVAKEEKFEYPNFITKQGRKPGEWLKAVREIMMDDKAISKKELEYLEKILEECCLEDRIECLNGIKNDKRLKKDGHMANEKKIDELLEKYQGMIDK